MAFRQALQLAACGLAGGSAAVLFSAVAVGKPRAGGDAEPRVVEAPAWAGTARPGPGVWDPNWDRCGAAVASGAGPVGGRALGPWGSAPQRAGGAGPRVDVSPGCGRAAGRDGGRPGRQRCRGQRAAQTRAVSREPSDWTMPKGGEQGGCGALSAGLGLEGASLLEDGRGHVGQERAPPGLVMRGHTRAYGAPGKWRL